MEQVKCKAQGCPLKRTIHLRVMLLCETAGTPLLSILDSTSIHMLQGLTPAWVDPPFLWN